MSGIRVFSLYLLSSKQEGIKKDAITYLIILILFSIQPQPKSYPNIFNTESQFYLLLNSLKYSVFYMDIWLCNTHWDIENEGLVGCGLQFRVLKHLLGSYPTSYLFPTLLCISFNNQMKTPTLSSMRTVKKHREGRLYYGIGCGKVTTILH